MMGEHTRAKRMAAYSGREGTIVPVGSVAGIVGALLAMVGNLLHPATPTGDPVGVARTIAESETWVHVHLVIVVGLILVLGGLVEDNALLLEKATRSIHAHHHTRSGGKQ